jgi:GrpB-like predicted nucleotidyltransferase (UPF0157 family)
MKMSRCLDFAARKNRLKMVLGSRLHGAGSIEDWVKCRAPLEGLGYDYAENAGVPEHHIFGRGRDRTERTHLVHVVENLGRAWRTCLAVRDALRNDPELRARYVEEKERAVAAAPEGRARYNQIKGPFLEIIKARLK